MIYRSILITVFLLVDILNTLVSRWLFLEHTASGSRLELRAIDSLVHLLNNYLWKFYYVGSTEPWEI